MASSSVKLNIYRVVVSGKIWSVLTGKLWSMSDLLLNMHLKKIYIVCLMSGRVYASGKVVKGFNLA